MNVDRLLALDDGEAKVEATRELARTIMMSAAFAPLRPGLPPVTSWISRAQWTADLGTAALRDWIRASGLGWVQTAPAEAAEPSVAFDAFFHADSPTHRQVATSLYLWALPRHCRSGDACLADYFTDGAAAGEALAAAATSAEFMHRLEALDRAAQPSAAGSILGKLHWLAPQRVAAVADAFAANLPGYAQAPLPPPETRSATGTLLPFCFDPAQVRGFLEPMMADAIHAAMGARDDVDLLEYSWSASHSAALALPQTESLTASALVAGVNRLSPPERALLTEALLKALPLLSLAIGPFVEQPLKDLYNAAHPQGEVA